MKDSHADIRGAVVDLLYLLEKGYPKKSALELVGNRYRLSSDGRMILYRGVFTRGECEGRMRKMSGLKANVSDTCAIDGYNVFITIESYLRGRLIFRALDGFIRDISGVYGNYTFGDRTEQATDLLIPCLQGALSEVHRFFVYLDEPVSRSGDFARFLRKAFEAAGIPAVVEVVRSPDEVIVERHEHDLIATSDTVLLDRIEHCTDIPDTVLVRGTVFDLQLLLRRELAWLGLT
jgi:hypothetical protein